MNEFMNKYAIIENITILRWCFMAKKNNEKLVETEIIDREKLIKEVKDEILKNLPKQVEIEVQGKLDKMEKRIYKQKQRTILKKNILIIILLLLVIFEGKILYDNGLLNNKNNNECNIKQDNIANNENEIEDSKEDLSWYIENYSYLLDNVRTNLDQYNKYYLYKENRKVEEIDNKIKLNIAYQNINKEDIISKDGFITFEETKLREAYQTIFNTEFKNENFQDYCTDFIYNESLHKYLAIEVTCSSIENEMIEEIIDIKDENNNIVITTVVGLKDKNNNNLTNIDGNIIYKNFNGDIKNYRDKLNSYEYIFTNKDNKYYFTEIKKVK